MVNGSVKMINVIQTGSKGNAVLVNSTILIDCGVPFAKLRPYYKKIELVLLTHVHSDHFKKATIKKLASERPTLRFGCAEWLVKPLIECGVSKRNIDVYLFDRTFNYGKIKINIFELVHDVPNCGYKIEINGINVFYATDTNEISTSAKDYDYYLIEANYGDDEIQERIANKIKKGEKYIYEYNVLENHLSKAKADAWLLENKGENGKVIYLHEHKN